MLKAQVEPGIADERLQRLQALIRKQQSDFNKGCEGKTMDILLEKHGRLPGQLAGRSPFLQAVHVDADEQLIGSILKVRIKSVGPNSLYGELL